MSAIQINDKIDERSSFKIARFKKDIRTTVAHKHKNYLEIIYLKSGSGIHQIDEQNFEIKPSTLFVVRKEQVHCWNLTSEPDGFVLILRNSLVVDGMDNEMRALFNTVSAFNCNYLIDATAIETIFELMNATIDLKEHDNTSYLKGLLKSVLARIAMNSSISEFHSNQTNHLFGQFNDLVSNEIELFNSVSYFAQKLNCTPQNLNAICRKELNISASEFIAKRIISEAKRLLIYSNLSISEIGIQLHFKDNSHFSKFFKKHTNTTPKSFRVNSKSDQ